MALASATIWGGGDFSGGAAVKAAGGTMQSAFRVVLVSHAVSLSILLTLSLLFAGPFPTGVTLAWGLLAGVLAALSLSTFYVAISAGQMGAAAALSGLVTAAIPAAVSSHTEGVPGALRLSGFCIAGLAIWLIAAAPASPAVTPAQISPGPANRRAMLLAIAAGVGFGFYFVAMKMAGRGGLLWPMTTVRIGSAAACTVLVLATLRRKPSLGGAATHFYLPRRALLWALGPALLDTGGNLLFMASTRLGRLDVASVLASLYPASTILLAAWLLNERPSRTQRLGMLVAVAAVVMITI